MKLNKDEEVTEKCDDNKMETNYVFVYGSLKQKGHLHHAMRDAVFIREAYTRKAKYALFTPNDQWPYLLKGSYHIKGELYQITSDIRTRLDWVEGHPNLFTRKMFKLRDFGEKVYVYVGSERFHEVYQTVTYNSPRISIDKRNRIQEWLVS